MKILSFDIGGTKIAYAKISGDGEFLSQISKIKTPKTATEIFDELKRIISEAEDIDAVAISTAGAVNLENTSVMSSTPNMPKGYNSTDFSTLTNKPVFIENDANAAALAEYKLGAARGFDNNITITLGTGIGAGIVIEGSLLRGKSGRGGEAGSLKIYPDRRRQCTCGNYDCWESYASGPGLLRTYKEEFAKEFPNYEKVDKLTTYDLIEGFKSGDELCKKVMEIWHNHLFAGLVSLNNIFDTEIIVLSGGMGKFADIKSLEERVNAETVCSPLKIRYAEAENNAGMIGAALLTAKKFSGK